MLKIASLILIQFIPTVILFALRRIAPDFLLFESIILAVLIQLFLLRVILKIAKINLLLKRIFVSPLMVFLLSALVSFNLLFFSLMMIDRSKSLYVVKWVGSFQPVTKTALYEKIGISEKSSEGEYIEIRISEQKLRRVLSEQNGYLQLTVYGTLIHKTANIVAEIFLLDGWTSQNLNKRP